mgnify:FL=1
MKIEKRILRLESLYREPSGFTLSRVLGPNGLYWCIGLGQMMMPKDFFEGKTIKECLEKAEEFHINK